MTAWTTSDSSARRTPTPHGWEVLALVVLPWVLLAVALHGLK